MYFIGDVHGRIKQYRSIIRGLPEGSSSLQLGDMGIGFKGVHLYPVGCLLKGKHLWIRGNHDSPAACRAHPLYRGDYGYDESEKLFWLGGAWSIDQKWRLENVNWWRDEELSWHDLGAARELYVSSKPQIVATHEAPTEAARLMLTRYCGAIFESGHEFCATDEGVREKGPDYLAFKKEVNFQNTRTSQALQKMLEEWAPRFWCFGHYHVTKAFKIGETEFQCLGELAVREINL